MLIEDTVLIKNINEVIFFDGISESIKKLKSLNYKIFIVTNQTVVARGLLSLEQTKKLNKKIIEQILNTKKIEKYIDDIFICPHHPHAEIPEYRKDCECRKPKPGMILNGIKNYSIDPSKSFMIGDRLSDIVSGNLAKVTTIQITTSKHLEKKIISNLKIHKDLEVPNYKANSLKDAVENIIIKEDRVG